MKRPGWYMSDEEMVRAYKEALKKTEQIQILADLNCKKAKDVKVVLRENGLVLQGDKAKPNPRIEAQAKKKEEVVADVQHKIDESLLIELVKTEMCEKYCKYHDLLDRADNDSEWSNMLKAICAKCPLNRL